MKAIASLVLTVAAFSAHGWWGGALAAQAVPRDASTVFEAAPLLTAGDERWDVAAIFDDGPRPVAPLERPYDAVGLIENARRTRAGSGFLIGPCTVLTAYHVLFQADETPSKKAEFTFAVGHGGPREFDLRVKAKPVFWGNYSYTEGTPEEDFAVLHVPSCPGRKFAPIPLASMSVADIEQSGGQLRNAGYPAGHSKGRVWRDGDCTTGGAHPLQPELFAIDCDVTPGMSGGPVLAEVDGELLAVAIISSVVSDIGPIGAFSTLTGADAADLAHYNLAVPVSGFLARLNSLGLVGE